MDTNERLIEIVDRISKVEGTVAQIDLNVTRLLTQETKQLPSGVLLKIICVSLSGIFIWLGILTTAIFQG